MPIANYYDSFWNFISSQNFNLLQEAYIKLCALIDLLSLKSETKEDALKLIEEIVSSAGQGNEQTFNELYNRYFLKTNQCIALRENFNAQMQTLEEKNKALNLKILNYEATIKQKQEKIIQKKEENSMKNLRELTIAFMQDIESNMGWFSRKSEKKIIFNESINKLLSIKQDKLSKDSLVYLLKNFISLAVMNRFDKKGGETQSGKACLNLLNDPKYETLKKLLLFKQANLQYCDLLGSPFSGKDSQGQTLLTSARYRQAMYQSFKKIEDNNENKKITNYDLDLAMREMVYKPKAEMRSS